MLDEATRCTIADFVSKRAWEYLKQRDEYRRAGNTELATMCGDWATAILETAAAIRALPLETPQ